MSMGLFALQLAVTNFSISRSILLPFGDVLGKHDSRLRIMLNNNNKKKKKIRHWMCKIATQHHWSCTLQCLKLLHSLCALDGHMKSYQLCSCLCVKWRWQVCKIKQKTKKWKDLEGKPTSCLAIGCSKASQGCHLSMFIAFCCFYAVFACHSFVELHLGCGNLDKRRLLVHRKI